MGATSENPFSTVSTHNGPQGDLCDLYREGFDPVLSVRQRQMYRDTASNTENVIELLETGKRMSA
jgi:hypothetical protein